MFWLQYFHKFWKRILNGNSQKQIIQKIFWKKKNGDKLLFAFWFIDIKLSVR